VRGLARAHMGAPGGRGRVHQQVLPACPEPIKPARHSSQRLLSPFRVSFWQLMQLRPVAASQDCECPLHGRHWGGAAYLPNPCPPRTHPRQQTVSAFEKDAHGLPSMDGDVRVGGMVGAGVGSPTQALGVTGVVQLAAHAPPDGPSQVPERHVADAEHQPQNAWAVQARQLVWAAHRLPPYRHTPALRPYAYARHWPRLKRTLNAS
jgi:hypothetical protein